jgi:hypothetical protein
MSAASAAVSLKASQPRSRAKRLQDNLALNGNQREPEIFDPKKKGSKWVGIPVEEYSALLFGDKLKGKVQERIVWYLMCRLDLDRGYNKAGKQGPAIKFTNIRDVDFRKAIHIKVEDERMFRGDMDDLVLRGVVVQKPTGRGAWNYSLPVSQWHKVKRWEPKPLVKKPAEVEEDLHSVDQDGAETEPNGVATPLKNYKTLISIGSGQGQKTIIFAGAPKGDRKILCLSESERRVEIQPQPFSEDCYRFQVEVERGSFKSDVELFLRDRSADANGRPANGVADANGRPANGVADPLKTSKSLNSLEADEKVSPNGHVKGNGKSHPAESLDADERRRAKIREYENTSFLEQYVPVFGRGPNAKELAAFDAARREASIPQIQAAVTSATARKRNPFALEGYYSLNHIARECSDPKDVGRWQARHPDDVGLSQLSDEDIEFYERNGWPAL